MQRQYKFTAIMLSVLVLVLILPVLIGVWLPDVCFGNAHTLASARLTNGFTFQVIQYWNHVDFYTTELRVTSPDGHTEIHVLDGDDAKSWRVPMVVSEKNRTVTITLGGNRIKQVDW